MQWCRLKDFLFRIEPEVNCPEAVVTADVSKHLVVSSENSKELVVEEDVFKSSRVLHSPQVDPG